jgi:hypothetical protein
MMMGIGTPSNQSNTPRSMVFSLVISFGVEMP